MAEKLPRGYRMEGDIIVGPHEIEVEKKTFHCPACGNEFEDRAELAICDGVNARRDEKGRQVYEEDADGYEIVGRPVLVGTDGKLVERDENGRPKVIVGVNAHTPVRMEVA